MIDIEALVKSIALEREHQMRALRAAMTAILVRGQKGVVLADEVGCGKTYEALAIASLLWRFHHGTDAPVRRILVLANNALIQKWFDELETAYDASARAARGTQRGFQQYVQDASWQPLVNMMRNVVQLRRAHDGDVRGTREDGRIQVPADRIYLVRPDLLTRGSTQETSTTVRWLKRTKWDVLIIDEAHHFARINRQISRLFFPEETTQSRGEGLSARYILALTATPFQLKVQEILNLLRIIEAPEADIASLSDGLVRYEATLKKFYSRRHLHPSEPARARVVESLRALRVQNASGGDNPSTPGLESLLRRYLLRNVKDIGQRDYSLVERQDEAVRARPFGKLDDIQRLVSSSPLIPFDATDRWIYLNVRDLVADALASGVDDSSKRTFVSGDLRQMLSSYEQLRASTLVERTDLPRAKQVRALLRAARESRHPHPKVRAICDTVGAILDDEILRMRESPHRLVSKILVFNTMLQTARTLREALEDVVGTKLDPFVDESLSAAGFSSRKQVEELIREAVADERETIRARLRSKFAAEHLMLRPEHVKGTGVAIESGEREIVDVMFDRLINHMIQPMFVLRLARWCAATAMPADIEAVRDFLTLRITERLATSLDRIVDHYLDDTPLQGEAWSEENIERARREIGRLARILAAPQYVGRYDGDVDTDDREMRRENFNRPYAPVVLLVSAVGEEGIDLQQHTRYVLHYDVEWNPAKMEQREGRVDREGRRTTGDGAVRVNFFLLKDTYEERIFHTVMQRDAWFQIMIGSKRNELAKDMRVEGAESDGPTEDVVTDDRSRLTSEERAAVMLDLRP